MNDGKLELASDPISVDEEVTSAPTWYQHTDGRVILGFGARMAAYLYEFKDSHLNLIKKFDTRERETSSPSWYLQDDRTFLSFSASGSGVMLHEWVDHEFKELQYIEDTFANAGPPIWSEQLSRLGSPTVYAVVGSIGNKVHFYEFVNGRFQDQFAVSFGAKNNQPFWQGSTTSPIRVDAKSERSPFIMGDSKGKLYLISLFDRLSAKDAKK